MDKTFNIFSIIYTILFCLLVILFIFFSPEDASFNEILTMLGFLIPSGIEFYLSTLGLKTFSRYNIKKPLTLFIIIFITIFSLIVTVLLFKDNGFIAVHELIIFIIGISLIIHLFRKKPKLASKQRFTQGFFITVIVFSGFVITIFILLTMILVIMPSESSLPSFRQQG